MRSQCRLWSALQVVQPMTYMIPGRLAGANEMDAAASLHRYHRSTLKRKETRRCAQAAIAGGVPQITKPIKIHFLWVEPNKKRDLDNIRYGAKMVLDGLRECGRLPNDGWGWVVGMSDAWAVDKQNPRVEVSIETEAA